MTTIQHKFTTGERASIIACLKRVAVAQAEFWDILREIEQERDIEIEPDVSLVSDVAGGCDHPPATSDLDDEDVWVAFEESLDA